VPVELLVEPGMVDWVLMPEPVPVVLLLPEPGVVVDWAVVPVVPEVLPPVVPVPVAAPVGGVIGVVEAPGPVPGPAVPEPVVPEGPVPVPVPVPPGEVPCAKAMLLATTSARPQAVEVAVRMKEWDMLAPDVSECSTSVALTGNAACG
jgi:hypothetical protein